MMLAVLDDPLKRMHPMEPHKSSLRTRSACGRSTDGSIPTSCASSTTSQSWRSSRRVLTAGKPRRTIATLESCGHPWAMAGAISRWRVTSVEKRSRQRS